MDTDGSGDSPPRLVVDLGTERRAFKRGIKVVHSYEATMMLIECVRSRPVLWHKQYLRFRVPEGENAWLNIQQSTFPSKTVLQLKIRWKTLRDCYRRELKRVECGAQCGSSWMYFPHMAFLNGHYRIKSNKLEGRYPGGRRQLKRKQDARVSPTTAGAEPSEVISIASDSTVTDGLEPSAPATEYVSDVDEVTFHYKFRARQNSIKRSRMTSVDQPAEMDPAIPVFTQESIATYSDGEFLSRLAPCLGSLPPQRNLHTRLNILQIIYAALNAN